MRLNSQRLDVCYYAKVRILKQITTPYQYKILRVKMFVIDVCYYAKVRILQQITTLPCLLYFYGKMFVIMQR